MTNTPHRIVLAPCPKGYTRDLDKVISPSDTIARVRERLATLKLDILAATERVDVGRLGIPVYMSRCGGDARKIMPTRKQMGKGSSPEQAMASAIMELVERYSYFSFWQSLEKNEPLFWPEAEQRFTDSLMPVEEILLSVSEDMPKEKARRVLSVVPWLFYPATRLSTGELCWLPLDWFKTINEFNGCSAGNTPEESILQGLAELVERDVCARVDRQRLSTPTIRPESATDPTLQKLFAAFADKGIQLIVKDFSLDRPLPTIAALAWDPTTFPEQSEIVFTAGTASSAEKAAIRAITEVAQLAGDFCTHACYEASGLPKMQTLAETEWLKAGEVIDFSAIKGIERDDIRDEINAAIAGLAPCPVYSLATTHPKLALPAHYNIVPGLAFRERDQNQSLGLFTGRKLVEEGDIASAAKGLAILEEIYGNAHFIPFFKGMLALRKNDHQNAVDFFQKARAIQPDADAEALATFYEGYTQTLQGEWTKALPQLKKACELSAGMKEYANLFGVALFKTGAYAEAKDAFSKVLAIDKGSAMDLANLGLCEKMLGENAEAREHLDEALRLDPSLTFAANARKELGDQD